MGAPQVREIEADAADAGVDLAKRRNMVGAAVLGLSGILGLARKAVAQELTAGQCRVIGEVYNTLADGMDMSKISPQSAAELAKLGQWIDGGCRGNLTLRRYPDVAAYTHAMETVLRSPRLRNHGASISSNITFG